jgi:hypothetical protein
MVRCSVASGSGKGAIGVSRREGFMTTRWIAGVAVALGACALAFVAGCGDDSPSDNDYGVIAEYYTDVAAFTARLDDVNEVDFDDIDAGGSGSHAWFGPDRYADSGGIVITGEDGQYVSEDFGYPGDFPPVSSMNSYAPGPVSTPDGGGNATVVTFMEGAEDALTTGFGLWFTDADYWADGPCTLAVFDTTGQRIGLVTDIQTGDGESVFRGIVMIDEATGQPARVISRVRIVNGDGWPGGDDNEGVALDDFTFEDPFAP